MSVHLQFLALPSSVLALFLTFLWESWQLPRPALYSGMATEALVSDLLKSKSSGKLLQGPKLQSDEMSLFHIYFTSIQFLWPTQHEALIKSGIVVMPHLGPHGLRIGKEKVSKRSLWKERQ